MGERRGCLGHTRRRHEKNMKESRVRNTPSVAHTTVQNACNRAPPSASSTTTKTIKKKTTRLAAPKDGLA